MANSCWWCTCRIEERPAGSEECEGCLALVEYDEKEVRNNDNTTITD